MASKWWTQLKLWWIKRKIRKAWRRLRGGSRIRIVDAPNTVEDWRR